jgi:glycerophosphoryl diester phosphodiesterase
MGLDLPSAITNRGTSGTAPENAHVAAIKAGTLGCRRIEVDLQLTADDVPVVIYDHTLERTTNEYGAVDAATAPQLSVLEAGQ